MTNTMAQKKYLVGIDLGTTHTVVAYAAPGKSKIELFPIEQSVGLGTVAAQPLLPSARYHPAPGEISPGACQLPWPNMSTAGATTAGEPNDQPPAIIGRLARQLGAQVPGRLVTSAKSWLSHPNVDRTAAILPWGAASDVAKISPLAASSSYLAHVHAAWDHQFPKHPLAEQEIVLTIPASFDEGARALTLQAAQDAGLPKVSLVEEPQAAFYDWLQRQGKQLKAQLADSKLVLVVDVGGGTSDFSLIQVNNNAGQPELIRIGVGSHLMLGGDNMDLTLAHLAEQRLQPGGGKLSATQLSQLIERCRSAKEQLLAADAPTHTSVTLLGSGSKLIGGTRSIDLQREEVEHLIVDGFFPQVELSQGPQKNRSTLLEFGLPYASDAAITRHLAGFLQQHGMPDTLLLNGGVFRAAALARRLQDTLDSWGQQAVRLLANDNPDIAVARGAVAFALARLGKGPRIGGGAARSYYLLLDQERGNSPRPARAICLLPRGTEPGIELTLPERQFALRLGQPVRFHLVSSTQTQGHTPGSIVTLDQAEFDALPPIATVLKAAQNQTNQSGKQEVRVQLVCMLTEVGTMEIHCVALDGALDGGLDGGRDPPPAHAAATNPAQRWKLEFQLRGNDEADSAPEDAAALPARSGEALALIERIFGTRGPQVSAKEVKAMRAELEQILGPRERWSTPLLRHLFDALWQRVKSRRRSVEHERLWLNLIGYCLRPGFGYPLDDWRISQLWTLFGQGVQFPKDTQVCSEWWTLWRRVAGGLDSAAQLQLLDDFALNLQGSAEDWKARPAHSVAGNVDDMLRLGASLERIPAAYKAEIGVWLLKQIQANQNADASARHLWALARLGARIPFHGTAHEVVEVEVVVQWLEQLFAWDWRRNEAAAFAASHLARMCGDRTRDLPESVRAQVLQRLGACNAPAQWLQMVREVVQLDEAAQKRVLGDALPPGLKLL